MWDAGGPTAARISSAGLSHVWQGKEYNRFRAGPPCLEENAIMKSVSSLAFTIVLAAATFALLLPQRASAKRSPSAAFRSLNYPTATGHAQPAGGRYDVHQRRHVIATSRSATLQAPGQSHHRPVRPQRGRHECGRRVQQLCQPDVREPHGLSGLRPSGTERFR